MGRTAERLLAPGRHAGSMTSLLDRDAAAIAGLQKLRFFPQVVEGAAGSRLYPGDGREIIDFTAGWGAASLGYGHPAIVSAVCKAVSRPAGVSVLSAASAPATDLAELLIETFPAQHRQKVWLGHSGSDANETAIRAARRATGRQGIIAFAGAYHGCTTGTMAVSGHPALASDKAPGLIQLPYPSEAAPTAEAAATLSNLDRHLAAAGPNAFAACIFEPILSDGGVIVPPRGFLADLAAVCARHGILTICDEVKVGLARTGFIHAFEAEGFRPDILVLGKGLGGGLPLSAVIGPDWVMDCATAFAMQTLHGNPVCAAAGCAVVDAIWSGNLVAEAARKGRWLHDRLNGIAALYPAVGTVRGRGLVVGLEIVSRDKTGATAPNAKAASKLIYRAYQLGLAVYKVGQPSNVLELTPPLTICDSDLAIGIGILQTALEDLTRGGISLPDDAASCGW